MTEIVKVEKKRVIEPTEVIPPGGYGMDFAGPSNPIRSNFIYRTWHPSASMRSLGYVVNPDLCRHSRKGYTPRDGWWCRDCGDKL